MKKLSQLEALNVFTVSQGQPISDAFAQKLVKRGLAERRGGKLVISSEGRAAFERWSGTRLP